jgi:hypothetical protein
MSEPRPVAEPDHITQEWWDATREERLLLQRCDGCDARQFYPRNICTSCGSLALSWVPASGRATIYSYTTVRRAPHPAFIAPYVVALVRLEEGPTMLTNVVAGEPRCDAPVRLAWEPLDDGRKLPVFTME